MHLDYRLLNWNDSAHKKKKKICKTVTFLITCLFNEWIFSSGRDKTQDAVTASLIFSPRRWNSVWEAQCEKVKYAKDLHSQPHKGKMYILLWCDKNCGALLFHYLHVLSIYDPSISFKSHNLTSAYMWCFTMIFDLKHVYKYGE